MIKNMKVVIITKINRLFAIKPIFKYKSIVFIIVTAVI